MKLRIKKHLWYYVSFIIIQAIGFLLVLFTAANKEIQMTAIILTTMCYILWALAHQHIHHSLTAKIVVEYVLVGSLGITVSLFLFNV